MKNMTIHEHTSGVKVGRVEQNFKSPESSEDQKPSAFSIKFGDGDESNEQAIQLDNDQVKVDIVYRGPGRIVDPDDSRFDSPSTSRNGLSILPSVAVLEENQSEENQAVMPQ